MTTEAVNPKVFEFFEKRGIGPETVTRTGIYSARRRRDGDDQSFATEPDPNGNIIAFPFFERGEVVAEKYRAPGKKFYQRPKPRKTFYNSDILDDPALAASTAALVITEGEMDALSVIEAGYPFAVSVPDGAPPARDKNGRLIAVPENADDVDPENDDKFAFVFNNWDRLQRVKRIVIAVDNDEPGTRLAAELVRRLGRVRCSFVAYPEGCKDLNDVLLHHGPGHVINLISQARPYPVRGLYTLSEFPPEPELRPVSTGWPELDAHVLVYHPSLMVITGFANAGKTSFATQMVAQLASQHRWNAAIASFEMRVNPFIRDALIAGYLQRPRPWSNEEKARGRAWVEQHFTFIAPDPESDDDTNLDWLIEKAEAAVIRHGARVLLLDPWNEVDHARKADETHTEYVGRALRRLKTFARRFDVLVIIVAHPSKGATFKSDKDLSLYDVADSAHFANKADQGLILVKGREEGTSTILVKKIRYQPETGRPGEIPLKFDLRTRLFTSPDPEIGGDDGDDGDDLWRRR
ncbi:DnaB-like helicase C-terminal domain-containing protein [Enterovirga rhinocerotis]|uniref:Twinkle protein n=1 Tax=Enterovirga rhinocerotis TaxID=1339210 RepID=A0A4R7BWM5_9HYPH|nr:DnaB-like helicase C-terminal domain-containing protein [Enterovirga rhinocerotis]TDR90318.1 twinkle protein [Enterovirga rhinocerotis]